MARKPLPPTPIVSDESALMEDLEDTTSNIMQEDTPPPPRAGKVTPKVVMPGNKGVETMRILLEDNADIPPSGQFVGHNGVNYMLRPGVWMDVPLPIIEVLDNAIMQVPQRDPITNQITGWREKKRYPYRIAPGTRQAA